MGSLDGPYKQYARVIITYSINKLNCFYRVKVFYFQKYCTVIIALCLDRKILFAGLSDAPFNRYPIQ